MEPQQATTSQPVPKDSPSPLKQAPSPSLQPSPLSSSPRPTTPQQRVQRQAPPGKAKKIKRKAARPGQAKPSEPHTGTLVDLTDIPRHTGDQPSSISSESEEQTTTTQPRSDSTAEEPDSSLADIEQTHSSSPHRSRQSVADSSSKPTAKHNTISLETHEDKVTQDTGNSASKTSKIDQPIEQPSVVTEQPSVVTEQPSVVTEQPSVVTEQPSVVTEQPSVVTEQPSVVTEQPSVVTDLPSVVTDPPSIVAKYCPTTDKVSDSTDDTQEPISSKDAIITEEDSQEKRAAANSGVTDAAVPPVDYTVELSTTEKLETMVEAVESNLTTVRYILSSSLP